MFCIRRKGLKINFCFIILLLQNHVFFGYTENVRSVHKGILIPGSMGGLKWRLFFTFFKASCYYCSSGVYYGDLAPIGSMVGKALVSDMIIMAFRSDELVKAIWTVGGGGACRQIISRFHQ